jgi:hypothetical protein
MRKITSKGMNNTILIRDKKRYKGREDEEGDISSYRMTLRKQEGTGI